MFALPGRPVKKPARRRPMVSSDAEVLLHFLPQVLQERTKRTAVQSAGEGRRTHPTARISKCRFRLPGSPESPQSQNKNKKERQHAGGIQEDGKMRPVKKKKQSEQAVQKEADDIRLRLLIKYQSML